MFKLNYCKAFKPIIRSRLYHSLDHPSSNVIVNSKALESVILNKALDFIPKYGFDGLCITQAARDLKYPDSVLSALSSSPSGSSLEFQLVLHWLKSQRQKLQDDISRPTDELHKITDQYDRISYLIHKRIEYNAPILSHLSQGISLLVIPYNVSQSSEELHKLSDDIAFYAGDISNDFAWYTKRFGISSIYVSSELYMLQDTSEGFVRTKDFVSDKVKAMKNLGEAYNGTEEWGYFNAISAVNLIKSQLLRG